ncbi:FliH/SctL family protein [Chromobacterium violaceum]|uniref:FliH/SctL family protein n=1 Tax=Chromobacterium violaceum TaxID=536 RepID=UPI0015949A51|nr:FliH/SctL family protein [Chromobacterium violaceum]
MSNIIRSPLVRAREEMQPAGVAQTAAPRAEAARPVDAEAEIRAMRARAMAEIEAARAKAKAECDAMRAKAGEEGYRAGMAKAETEIRGQLGLAAQQAKALLASMEQGRARMLGDMEDMLALVVFEALIRVVGDIPQSRELVQAGVRRAMLEVVGREPVRVRLHPADAALLDGAALGDAGREIHLVADDSLERGGCLVETAHGDIDARWSTQLERLHRALREAGRA